MHRVELKIEDNIYQNVMFLLNNLNLKGLVINEKKDESKSVKQSIQQLFKSKDIKLFNNIDDPIAWQKQQRDEW